MSLMNSVLKDFWQTKSRYKVLYGGRASSKSHDACGWLAYIASKYKLKVLAVRQFQTNIKDSVYSLIKEKISTFDLQDQYRILDTRIYSNCGSEFMFYGIKRNIDEIKSTEGVDILYIEEAHALTSEQWDILKPTIRKENSEIWIIFNPNLETDFVYRRFILNTPNNCIKRHINYNENPFLSKTAREEIEELKLEDLEHYEHIYLGHAKKDDDEAVIKRSWIEAAIDSHVVLGIEPTGTNNIGYDVADSGADKNCYINTKGILTTEMHEWKGKEDELRESAFKVYNKAKELNANIVYDSIGVGAGVGSNINEFNKSNNTNIISNKFNAGDKVKYPEKIYKQNTKNKDMFANLKAQEWWNIADRFRLTYNAIVKGQEFNKDEIISIDSNLPGLQDLIIELSTPKRDYDLTGKVKVESKKDLAKRDIKSPNKADAFIMAYHRPFIKREVPKVQMQGIKGVMS